MWTSFILLKTPIYLPNPDKLAPPKKGRPPHSCLLSRNYSDTAIVTPLRSCVVPLVNREIFKWWNLKDVPQAVQGLTVGQKVPGGHCRFFVCACSGGRDAALCSVYPTSSTRDIVVNTQQQFFSIHLDTYDTVQNFLSPRQLLDMCANISTHAQVWCC